MLLLASAAGVIAILAAILIILAVQARPWFSRMMSPGQDVSAAAGTLPRNAAIAGVMRRDSSDDSAWGSSLFRRHEALEIPLLLRIGRESRRIRVRPSASLGAVLR